MRSTSVWKERFHRVVTKLLSMLGLARRAGKLESGFDAAVIAAREGKAALLLAARDISEKTFQNLRYEAEKAGIPVVRIPADIEETSRACGRKAGVHALTDRGFAKAVLSMVEDGKREKEECVL
jgi:ribosomal protein L7Ae-like RNA K-turn-binding protein